MTMNPKAGAFLRTLPLFGDLSDRANEVLAITAQPFSCGPGELLFRQGDPASSMYCIEHGRVLLSQRVVGDEQSELGQVGAGAVLGELALVDRDLRSVSATALENTTGYSISDAGFSALRAVHRRDATTVLRRLAANIGERLVAKTRDQLGAPAPPPLAESAVRAAAIARQRASTASLALEILAQLPLLAEFQRDELAQLVGDAHRIDLPRHHVIFAEGDPPTSCFVVVRGAVQATQVHAGQIEKLALLGPGRLFAELALFSTAPRSATCATRENTILLEIEPHALERLLTAESDIAYKFCSAAIKQLARALRNADRRHAWRAVRGRIE